jgi:hypothetical protein
MNLKKKYQKITLPRIFFIMIFFTINCSNGTASTINTSKTSQETNTANQIIKQEQKTEDNKTKVQEQNADNHKTNNETSDKNHDSKKNNSKKSRNPNWPYLQEPACQGSGTVKFTNSPMNLADIKYMVPYGQVVGAHITPIDHMYLEPLDRNLGPDIYPVRAIQDGVIFDIGKREINVDMNRAKKFPDWRLDIAHTCTFGSYFDLITSVIPEIEEAYNSGYSSDNSKLIKIKAGQLLGYVGGQTLDFGVYDYSYTLPGFINPNAYNREPWKVHTVDPFQYFLEPTRDQLLKKMIRKVEPRAGKIDYDVDGTLSGNWFEKGTDHYNGIIIDKYWDGHLSIAPDFLDPTIWIAAIGSIDEVYSNKFAITNADVPVNVTVDSGPIIYTLHRADIFVVNDPGRDWFREPIAPDDQFGTRLNRNSAGIIMFELLEDRLLKAEVFLGKKIGEVTSFTDKARTYIR